MSARLKLTSLLLLITLFSSLLLVSCHGRREVESFEMPIDFDEEKQYEITFWAKNENNKTQRSVYESAIKGFEAAYPNVSVTIKHYTDYGAIYNDVITNIQTATTPNVCITYPDHIATYITGENVVVPIAPLAQNDKYGFGGSEVKFDAPSEEEMVDKFLGECYIGDTLYAVPFMRSTEACYVNKDMVEALGYELPEIITWDFMFEVATAAMKKNPDGTYAVNGQKVMKPIIYKSTDNMMIQMLEQLDAGYSTDNAEILMFNDTTKDLLIELSGHVKTGAFTTFKIDSYPANFLNKGQCIFAIDSTAGATWMGSEAPLMDVPESSIVHFETAVLPVPQFNVNDPEMISQGPSLCIFNKEDPGEVVASWLFVQYLLTNEVQIAYSQTEGYVPVTEKAQESSEYLDYLSAAGKDNELHYDVKIAATKMLIDNVDNTFVTPVFNGSTSLRNAAGQMIESVTKSTRRNERINDAYVRDLYSDVSSLYRLDMISSTGPGAMPLVSSILCVSLALIWVLLGAYVLAPKVKKLIETVRQRQGEKEPPAKEKP